MHDVTSIVAEDWPASELETVGVCPACGSRERAVLYSDLFDVVFRAAPGRWTFWRCDGCRSAYLDPRPKAEAIHRAYAVYYTHALKPSARKKPVSWRTRVGRRAADSYRNAVYGTRRPSLGSPGRLMMAARPGQQTAIDREFRYIRRPKRVARPRLLDVGCGDGAFLSVMREAGWETCGCEPDDAAIGRARCTGSEVRAGGIESWASAGASFDAITLNHVLEHLHEPRYVLGECTRLLKPGGTVFIETPNVDAYGHELYGPSWRGLEVPRHLVIFTPMSLLSAVEEAGLEVARIIRHDNFIKQCRRSAAIEKGLGHQDFVNDQDIRMPTTKEIDHARRMPGRSEAITLLCRKPASV